MELDRKLIILVNYEALAQPFTHEEELCPILLLALPHTSNIKCDHVTYKGVDNAHAEQLPAKEHTHPNDVEFLSEDFLIDEEVDGWREESNHR